MYVSWKYFVLVLVLAVSGHDVCDETDLSYLLQGRTSSIDALKFAPFSKQIPKIFCWVIEGPETGPLVELVTQQMAGCDDHLVFSNHSSREKMVKLYTDDMILDKVLAPNGHAWLNNTGMVAKAYEFLSNSEIPDNFDWLVKVDSDTFFRPAALPRILADHDPSKALTFTSYVHVEGALEVASRGVFRKYGPGALFNDTLNVNEDSIFDDRWLEYAVKHMGGEVVELPPTECTSLVLNGYNVRFPALPNLFKHYNGNHGTWRPELWKEDFGTTPPCLRRDVVAIHPVKDVETYREFQRLTR